MKTLQVPFNLRVSGTVSWQKRSRWNCMCHDAGVLAYTLASWHGFRKMAPFSVTTHEFSMKVLRRGRSIQLREMSTIPHFIVNNRLPTVIARNTFSVIARLHRRRGNLNTMYERLPRRYASRNDSVKVVAHDDMRNRRHFAMTAESLLFIKT